MTGLPVKLAGDSGAAMHQLLSGRIAVTCPIVGAFIRFRIAPLALPVRYLPKHSTNRTNVAGSSL
jgi:hypothetical protein